MGWKAGLEYEQEEVGFYLCDEAGQVVLSSDVRPSADVIRLIAAAPDLLEALQEALHGVEGNHPLDADITSWQEAARAAIAKATGEQQ